MSKMIKNTLKKIYKSHRIGTSVGKTLLWIWIRRDLPKIFGDLGIDLAGGSMGNKRFFATKNYMSVDIDQTKLDLGKFKYPDALIKNCDIESFLNTQGINPDVLLCVQTMGTNELFNHDRTEKVITQMYHFLKPGGSMLFNIGSNTKDFEMLKYKLSNYLIDKFEFVDANFYGALHETKKKSLNPILRLTLAYVMNFIPPLRTLFGFRKRKLYFCCLKK